LIIKNIYIESFGGLLNKSFDFNEGFNIIYGENEYGKSTIAEFIKIMLYGFGRSPQNIRENERVKFMTWGKSRIGGQMTIIKDNTKYILARTFGKRKSEDTISMVNTTTGVKETNFTQTTPGELLLGINRATFENTAYIKQLYTKISYGTDDEIINRLINLAQSGDDSISYRRALEILDKAAKEIEGKRPKGKIQLIQDEINSLHTSLVIEKNKQLHKTQLKEKLRLLQQEKLQLESFHPNSFDSLLEDTLLSNKSSSGNSICKGICTALAFLSVFLLKSHPAFSIMLFTVCVGFFIYLSIKSNKAKKAMVKGFEELKKGKVKEAMENKEKLTEVIKEIAKVQFELENQKENSIDEIEAKLSHLEGKLQHYRQKLSDIRLAKSCIEKAFSQLQSDFGPRLSSAASNVLSQISNGKYTEVLISHDYSMKIKDEKGEFQDGEYLSCGAFDQIYFALRMSIINLLLPSSPIILDEAFAHYDDRRLASSLEYLKSLKNRQIFLFTCHKREQEYVKRAD
jgi:uncharacterized protein YhaN